MNLKSILSALGNVALKPVAAAAEPSGPDWEEWKRTHPLSSYRAPIGSRNDPGISGRPNRPEDYIYADTPNASPAVSPDAPPARPWQLPSITPASVMNAGATPDVSRVPLPAPSLLPPQPPAGSPPINPANLPAPNTPNFEPTAGLPSARALPPPATADLSNVGKRISFGQQGLTGTDRLAQITQALQESDPESEVKVTPSGVQVGPPPMKGATPHKGRFKAALETGLSSLAHADPAMLDNHPLYMLGQGIGGAIGGAVSPRTGAKVQRYNQILDAQTDEMRGLKVAGEEAKVGGLQAEARYRQLEPAIENAKLELERQRIQGVIDDKEYQRQKDVLDRASREKTNATSAAATIEAAKIRANATKGAGGMTPYQQYEINRDKGKNKAAREAKINESSSLYKKADDNEKNAQQLEESLRTKDGKLWNNNGQEITDGYEKQQETERRKKVIDDLRNEARTYRANGDKARSEGEAIPLDDATATSGPTLQGAIDAFKASNNRDPNDKELANIKKHYGFQ